MNALIQVLTGVVALLHTYFLVLEMFLWQKPRGLQTFRMTPEKAAATAVLAANQGLYNGFLVVALVAAMLLPAPCGETLRWYGLGCCAVAGIYGGITVSRRIFFVQAVPALLALALCLERIS